MKTTNLKRMVIVAIAVNLLILIITLLTSCVTRNNLYPELIEYYDTQLNKLTIETALEKYGTPDEITEAGQEISAKWSSGSLILSEAFMVNEYRTSNRVNNILELTFDQQSRKLKEWNYINYIKLP